MQPPRSISPLYGLADLHIHSRFSDGIDEVPDILDYVERNTSLDVMAIADHDTMDGYYAARDLMAKKSYRFQLVPAMEVSTREREAPAREVHLLALFLESPVPSYGPLHQTIRAIHARGGLCVAAHTMCRQRNSMSREVLEQLLADPDITVHPDGLETMEDRVARIVCVEDAEGLNRQLYHLAELGNSDGHALSIIGTRYTLFRGKTAGDLRSCILERSTRGWSGPPPAATAPAAD